jgi:serine/threonine protein kinase
MGSIPKHILKKYECVKHIDRENVYLVKNKQNEYFVIKVNNKITSNSTSFIEHDIHLKLTHPNIIKMFDYYENDLYQVYLLEYMNGGDLFNLIRTKMGIKNKMIVSYLKQIVSALKYCHSKGIIHRDIKAENILCSLDQKTVKLCDFGLATYSPSSTQLCGTYQYLAPEIVLGITYNYKVDLWSLGILLYDLYYFSTPFYNYDINIMFNNIYKKEPQFPTNIIIGKKTFPSNITPNAKDLIIKLLSKNPNKRPSLDDILQHPFCQEPKYMHSSSKSY